MATPLLDAMIANIAGDMNKDAKTERRLVDQHIREKDQDLVLLKLESLGLIRDEIAKLDDSTPVSVRTAYEKLLAQALGSL